MSSFAARHGEIFGGYGFLALGAGSEAFRFSAIESAFLKESSDVFDIGFTTEKRLKVKVEVDIDPPPCFKTEMIPVVSPRTFWARTYDLLGLYAGKVSAALFRMWKTCVKGRDWYDLAWYIANNVELDLTHLIERTKEDVVPFIGDTHARYLE